MLNLLRSAAIQRRKGGKYTGEKYCLFCHVPRVGPNCSIGSWVYVYAPYYTHVVTGKHHDDFLSSTQANVASHDAIISQLEERCEELEAQVSPAVVL